MCSSSPAQTTSLGRWLHENACLGLRQAPQVSPGQEALQDLADAWTLASQVSKVDAGLPVTVCKLHFAQNRCGKLVVWALGQIASMHG